VISLIKLYLFIVLISLSGCIAGPSLYSEALRTSLIAIKSNEILIDDRIRNIPYAMQISKIGNSDEVLLVLVEERNGDLIWTSATKELIVTRAGKVIKTIGLLNDIEITNPPDLNKISNEIYHNNDLQYEFKSLITFTDPKASLLERKYNYSFIKKEKYVNRLNSKEVNVFVIEERVRIPLIKFKAKNYYWVDDEFNVLKSIQKTAPNMKFIELVSLKKYNGK
jgi:hypothetical protein